MTFRNSYRYRGCGAIAAALLVAPACAGGAGGTMIEIFPGYGNPRLLHVSGKAHETPGGTWWGLGSAVSGISKSLSSLAHPFRDAERGELVTLQAGAVRTKARTGDGGYFDAVLPAAPGAPWEGAVGVKAVSIENEEFHGTAYVPSRDSKTGLISDIDNTVKMTSVADTRAFVKDALRGDETTDRPVPGMAQLYAKFAQSGTERSRAVCYVSASPDALAARIAGFLSINQFPPGPLMLPKLGLPGDARTPSPQLVYDHKITAIQDILAAWPEKKFVLFGDSGQEDPEIYRCIAAQYPSRVRGIYIRRAGEKDPAKEKECQGCVFFDSAEEAEKDLVRKGIISD